MKRSSLVAVAVVAAALVFGWPSESKADLFKAGLGFNVGGAFVTQDLDTDLEADPGLIVGVSGRVAVTGMIVVGVGLDYQMHDVVDSDDFAVAEITTLTVMPFVELHFPMPVVSPYLVLGLGYNLNSIDEGGDCTGCDLDIDNTVGVKVGGGVEVELTDSFSVNGEVAWMLNSGELEEKNVVGKVDAKANAATVSVGLRWYFL